MSDTNPLRTAGVVLGIGMGGFIDGIAAHQLLQIHNMLSARIPVTTLLNAEINMFWDGLFHALTWTATLFGIYLLWRAGGQKNVPWSGNVLAGAMIFGWGLFNFVEGILDHYVLQVHHLVERLGLSAFDAAFVAPGAIFMLGGRMLMRRCSQ